MFADHFEQHVRKLSEAFDSRAGKEVSLKHRSVITEALEGLLYEVVDLVQPDTFLEVGAYEAGFSKKMKISYPEADVVALEANPRVHARFRNDLAESGVRYLEVAAGRVSGVEKFYIPEVIAGNTMPYAGRMGSLREVGLRGSETSEVEVEVTTLDILASELAGRKFCIWIDVEGLAYEVLVGAGTTLERTDILYCEMESSPVWKGQALSTDLFGIIADAGFTMIARDCQKWFQHNGLFVRSEILRNLDLRRNVERYVEASIRSFADL